ncbi:PREDICTED: uncharacterized protein LOC109236540 [Nicotiana attenuata]|uniref:uncharacterized protein LOC109236540 n=1 Tax=Nicotiana attenuata TaxID=49451 RepID=UPI0009048885|nr:PREDICTED: uncharacterized protein LOC109236540 [Nicotiana attenuata]
MKLPPGYSVPLTSNSGQLVCKLQKSLYGLRQGSGDSFVVLAVYVDDIILTGTDSTEISALKSFLHQQFRIKDLGSLSYFLGIEVLYSSTDVSSVLCPLDLNVKLKANEGDPLLKPELYRSLIGKLNFLTHTRPDISYAVQHLSQFMQSPCLPHMSAGLHLLRYLKGTSEHGIFFNASPDLSISAFCDSDWAACPDTRRYVSGYCVLLGGSLVVWKSKKQPIVSMCSAEAEYRAMSKGVAELTWLSRLLTDLGLPCSSSIPLFCDSQAAIHIARNPVFHERTKHIELDCHLVRTKLAEGLIHLVHTSSSTQLADLFTKPLPGAAHHGFLLKLGVFPPSNLKGGVGVIERSPD